MELSAKRFCGSGLAHVFFAVASERNRNRSVAFGPLVCELERVLGRRQLQAQTPERVLACEPAVLSRLHLRAPIGEL